MRTRCGWIIGALFVTQPTGAAAAAITVQVYNAASAPESQVRKALVEAGWILQQAGIETQWVECGNPARDGAVVPACVQRTERGLFVLSILAGDPRAGESRDALGFAVLAGRRNGAAVIYPRVVSRLSDHPEYSDCDLLASVISHELGHLLLRSSQHGEGIMKANWGERDFAAMKQRRLKFSPAQAREFRGGFSWRNEDTSLSPVGSN
jgi:hypothetical protein